MISPNVNELYAYLNEKIPSSLSCDWDNDGLMVAVNCDRKINKILLALDVTENIVSQAKDMGCDTIISHHPLIFKPLSSLNISDTTARIALACANNDIAVMSFHTRLDAIKGGVNDVFAELIGVRDTSEFGPDGEEIGRIGDLEYETNSKELALRIKKILGADSIRLTDANKPVKKVALLGGSGKDYVIPAKLAGADAFITGEINYNTGVIARDYGISIIEAGHYFTEAPVLNFIKDLIQREFPSIQIEFAVSNPTITL